MSNRVQFEVLPDDYVALLRHQLANSPKARHSHFGTGSVVSIVLVLVVLFAAAYRYPFMSPMAWLLLATMGIPIVVIVIVKAVTWRNLPEKLSDRQLKAGHGWNRLGVQSLEISPDALHYTSQLEDTRLAWRGVFMIDQEGGYVSIWDGPNSAFIIPARAFPTPQSMRDFTDQAQAFKAAAPNYERECPVCHYDLHDVPTEGCPECGWRRSRN